MSGPLKFPETEMGTLMRDLDWSATRLGPIASWSPALFATANLILANRFPMLLWWGPDSICIYNDAYSPVLGAKHPEALGRPVSEVWAEVWEVLRPLILTPLHGGPPTWLEDLPLDLRRHGFLEETHWTVAYSAVPDETAPNGIGGVLATVHEITGQIVGTRRSELLRELGTRVGEAKSAADVCRAAMDVFAKNSADIPFASLHLIDDGNPAPRLVGSTSSDGALDSQKFPVDEAMRSRVTTLVDSPKRALILPITSGPDHETIGVLVAGITTRLSFDASYRQFLEMLAAQLALAITNARAYDFERRRAESLAELDRAKTAFFSNVSHEFRTPLTLMLGPTEEALRSSSPKLEGEDLQLLHRNELRLLKLVNTLLDFARIEAGRSHANRVETDLSSLTRELANAFDHAVHSAGLEFTIDCPPLERPALVDHEMWEKIVLNLLSNALKFTFEGSITVRVERIGDEAVLSVADTGVGIPDAELPQMFDRFHRVVGTRARTHEGSGIGLALVQELVKMNGGSIEVESALGRGSTFRVHVPLERASLASGLPIAATDSAPTANVAAPFVQEAMRWLRDEPPAPTSVAATNKKYEAERILVADDNNDMRDYVVRLLSEHWSVESVRNGDEALAAIRRQRPDLVVTDVMMPGLDGFGLLRALREGDAALPDLPVILLSARAGLEATSEGLAAGADDYLVKPFSARELLVRVTARLNIAKTRARERQRLLTLLEQIPANVNFFRGPEFVFELAHPLAVKALGGRKLLGRKLLEAMPEHLGQPFYARIQNVYATGEPFSQRDAEARLVVDGREIVTYWNSEYLAVRDESGRIDGVMTFDVDVTAQVEATRRLEDGSRAKDDFLAMLGHELRNPLAPISTAIHLLKLRGKDEIAREVSVIERQARHIERLVDDLLDVSRIASGKISLNRDSVELADLVAGAIELASPIIEHGHHTLVVNVPHEGFVVDVDRGRMLQVFANLLTNAAKYTPAGGRISITAVREASEIVITFEDTGIGISAELLPRVFDLFVQSRQTIDRSQGGLGLGLAIVKNLLTMHGGSVSANSEGLGRGSAFIVRLPDARIAATRVAREAAPTPARSESGKRVLIVDDNEDGAEMLAETLKVLGYHTATAYDGPSALRVAAEFSPEVALLDIGLPVMDGYELATRLRERWSDVKLVAITGYGQDSDRERALSTGFQGHLTKPVSFNVLTKLIATLTGSAAQSD